MNIYDDVVTRLLMLGYTVTENDKPLVEYAIKQASSHILAQTNLAAVPEGLYYTEVDMTAGLFLQSKYAAGQLDASFAGNRNIKGITEGDVRVEYDSAETAAIRFDALLKRLTTIPEKQLAAYRRLKW